jgi:hypothetical protein
MEEMPNNLCQKRFNSSNLIAVILLFVSTFVYSQSAFVRLSADGLKKKEIQRIENNGIIRNSSYITYLLVDEKGHLQFDVASQHWPKIQILAYGDASIELTLDRNDTLDLTWNVSKKNFEITRNTRLNEDVSALNSHVNKLIVDFTKRPPNRQNFKSFIQASDSLRRVSQRNTNAYVSSYQWYAAGDLDMMSAQFSQERLIQRIFKNRLPQPLHPAWRNTFHSIYENSMLNDVAKGNTDLLKDNIKQGRWSILYDWVAADTNLCDSVSCKWVVLKNCYDLSFHAGYDLPQLYTVLEDAKSYYIYDTIMKNELESILNYWKPRIKGNDFPDLKITDLRTGKSSKLTGFNGKPVYFGILPDYSLSSMLIISQFKALETKYGKMIEFVLILPKNSAKQETLIKQYPSLTFVALENSDGVVKELFTRNDQAGYAMINSKGKTYQFPAEGPETDVENAFWGLIKDE